MEGDALACHRAVHDAEAPVQDGRHVIIGPDRDPSLPSVRIKPPVLTDSLDTCHEHSFHPQEGIGCRSGQRLPEEVLRLFPQSGSFSFELVPRLEIGPDSFHVNLVHIEADQDISFRPDSAVKREGVADAAVDEGVDAPADRHEHRRDRDAGPDGIEKQPLP